MPGKRSSSDLSRHVGYNVTVSQQVSMLLLPISGLLAIPGDWLDVRPWLTEDALTGNASQT